jgi:hypothetical protein
MNPIKKKINCKTRSIVTNTDNFLPLNLSSITPLFDILFLKFYKCLIRFLILKFKFKSFQKVLTVRS